MTIIPDPCSFKRPKLLVCAAKMRAKKHKKSLAVSRHFANVKENGKFDLTDIYAEEDRLETMRKEKDAGYSPRLHVAFLATLYAELEKQIETDQPHAKASGSDDFRFSIYSFNASSTAGSIEGC